MGVGVAGWVRSPAALRPGPPRRRRRKGSARRASSRFRKMASATTGPGFTTCRLVRIKPARAGGGGAAALPSVERRSDRGEAAARAVGRRGCARWRASSLVDNEAWGGVQALRAGRAQNGGRKQWQTNNLKQGLPVAYELPAVSVSNARTPVTWGSQESVAIKLRERKQWKKNSIVTCSPRLQDDHRPGHLLESFLPFDALRRHFAAVSWRLRCDAILLHDDYACANDTAGGADVG